MMYAKYTVVLKTLLDSPEVKAKIDEALSQYPLYASKSKQEFIPAIIPTREQLNKKILDHFKYREIGFETVGRWLDEMRIAMDEIMPYYNQLYFTADQDYNIIFNVDYRRETERHQQGENETETQTTDTAETETASTAEDTTTTENNVDSNTKGVKSGTPQSNLSVPAKDIESVTYADEVNWGKDNSKSNGTSTSNGSTTASSTTTNTGSGSAAGTNKEDETIVETTKGNFGVVSAQDLVAKYREIILNIDRMILQDPRLNECFMLVY